MSHHFKYQPWFVFRPLRQVSCVSRSVFKRAKYLACALVLAPVFFAVTPTHALVFDSGKPTLSSENLDDKARTNLYLFLPQSILPGKTGAVIELGQGKYLDGGNYWFGFTPKLNKLSLLPGAQEYDAHVHAPVLSKALIEEQKFIQTEHFSAHDIATTPGASHSFAFSDQTGKLLARVDYYAAQFTWQGRTLGESLNVTNLSGDPMTLKWEIFLGNPRLDGVSGGDYSQHGYDPMSGLFTVRTRDYWRQVPLSVSDAKSAKEGIITQEMLCPTVSFSSVAYTNTPSSALFPSSSDTSTTSTPSPFSSPVKLSQPVQVRENFDSPQYFNFTRQLTGLKQAANVRFNYRLVPLGKNPAPVEGLASDFSIDFNQATPDAQGTALRQGQLDFSKATFAQSGLYHFLLTEVASTDPTRFPVDETHHFYLSVAVYKRSLDWEKYALRFNHHGFGREPSEAEIAFLRDQAFSLYPERYVALLSSSVNDENRQTLPLARFTGPTLGQNSAEDTPPDQNQPKGHTEDTPPDQNQPKDPTDDTPPEQDPPKDSVTNSTKSSNDTSFSQTTNTLTSSPMEKIKASIVDTGVDNLIGFFITLGLCSLASLFVLKLCAHRSHL